jgi:uncharacterized protein (DUF885 family)
VRPATGVRPRRTTTSLGFVIEDFAGRLLRDSALLDPCLAVVEAGEQEVDGLTDYSPDGHQARADLAARALRELEKLPAENPLHAHLTERLRARSAVHDAGEDLRELHAAATGPRQLIRQCVEATVQELLEVTTVRLHDVHFDIPAPLRRIETRVTVSAGTSYTGPSQDLTRPGRVWWFLPENQTSFPTWYAYSVAYHEGVPGHHLQIGNEACRGGLGQRLKLLGGLSGCQEGWALYAPSGSWTSLGSTSSRVRDWGYLFSQLLRAARVVLDIGLHLRLPVPSGGGVAWTPDAALQLLRDRCHQGPYASAELARYLGRPGQALTYKVGERVWLAGRSSFPGDRRAFHRRALELGPLGLDHLTRALSGTGITGTAA